jgi:hypothetical protein
MTQKIVAFVAKSFNPMDEVKIAPIIKIFEAFEKTGFFLQSAEKAEVESVSQKVRGLIDDSDVLIGFFTKRHPVYRVDGWSDSLALLLRKLEPIAWSAPPWVLQESGYALKGNKTLILFKEEGVEIPGLQGDLEYISFDPQKPGSAILRATEIVNDLIAKARNITVEIVVDSAGIETKGIETAAPPQLKDATDSNLQEPDHDLIDKWVRFRELLQAIEEKDWGRSETACDQMLAWVRDNEPETELFWKCFYQHSLFEAGKPEALQELRNLASANEMDDTPLSFIGACLADLHEFEDSVASYLKGATLAKGNRRISLTIKAAEVLQKAQKNRVARKTLLDLMQSPEAQDSPSQFLILQSLYFLSKDNEDTFERFAIGELALHHSPESKDFRFSLAYDYESAEQSLLALYHYKIICGQDERHGSALNNYGISLISCDLAGLAVKCFKRAMEFDDTLAASNLSHRYLAGGLTDDAISILKAAQQKQDCAPQVSSTLAATYEKIDANNLTLENLIVTAEKQRRFFLDFAKGLFAQLSGAPTGRWKFCERDIELEVSGSRIHGIRQTRTDEPATGYSSLFGGASPRVITTESVNFTGTLKGRSCKFKLETHVTTEPFSLRAGNSTTEGYILFTEDGLSAEVIEIQNGKPSAQYTVQKTA